MRKLYALGLRAVELRPSPRAPFTEKDEFAAAVKNSKSVVLIAEKGRKCAGFIYGYLDSNAKKPRNLWAGIGYVITTSGFRGAGVATKLLEECEKRLRAKGARRIYAWANAEAGSAAVAFFRKNGFVSGRRYRFMDKFF